MKKKYSQADSRSSFDTGNKIQTYLAEQQTSFNLYDQTGIFLKPAFTY